MSSAGNMELLKIEDPVECIVLKRVNRFVVEMMIRGRVARAYLHNTGRLLGYLERGRRAYCMKRTSGVTRYRLFAISDGDLAAFVDTWMQTRAFEVALLRGLLPWLRSCKVVRRNVKLGESIIDFLVECEDDYMYLELKSAALRGAKQYAMYPDCPTRRGRRHIRELISHVQREGLGAAVFIAGLPNVRAFNPNGGGDPAIPLLLREAYKAEVLIKALSMYYDPRRSFVLLDNPDLEIVL